MTTSLSYPGTATASTRDRILSLFAQTMGYVAATVALFSLGAYLGHDLSGGAGIVAFVAALASLVAMQSSARRTQRHLTVVLLAAFGLLLGLALAPTLAAYATADPQALCQAGAATALFVAGFGAVGYATRRDLKLVARLAFWALLGLIGFGLVATFVAIPHGATIYAVFGLVVFAGCILLDFQRIRRARDIASAPLLAASIFLDILNAFLLFLSLFTRNE